MKKIYLNLTFLLLFFVMISFLSEAKAQGTGDYTTRSYIEDNVGRVSYPTRTMSSSASISKSAADETNKSAISDLIVVRIYDEFGNCILSERILSEDYVDFEVDNILFNEEINQAKTIIYFKDEELIDIDFF